MLKETEWKLLSGQERAEIMKEETRLKAQEICQKVARKGSMYKEESEKAEIERVDNMLKKLEKR